MKLVHAADLHLDSPLRGLARYPGAPVERMRGATREALQNLVELCLRERAGLLVIAGDLYDGEWPDYSTGMYFAAQMLRLVAGWDASAEEMRRTARRIVTAKKEFNIRSGWTPAEDTLPRRILSQPLPDDPQAQLSPERLARLIRAFNIARGWTPEGCPS